MTKKTIIIVAAIILTIGLGSFLFGQKRDGAGFNGIRGGFNSPGDFPPAFLIDKVSTELGLSEDQKSQAKGILEASKVDVKPLFDKMRDNHGATKDLGTDGVFDESKVNEIANHQAETMKQLFVTKEKTKAQLFAILTPEQKERAKQLLEDFDNRMNGGHKDR